jgi:Ni/Fe-hydrogenase subunit HybB-like protein
MSKNGGVPACVKICPNDALVYGKRRDLMALAHERIRARPDVYVDHVYGEHEAGGTSWLYLSNVPFEQLGFVKLGSTPPAQLTEAIQHGIFKFFMPPLALYALLGIIMRVSKQEGEAPAGSTRPGDSSPARREARPPETAELGIRIERNAIAPSHVDLQVASSAPLRSRLGKAQAHACPNPVSASLRTPGVFVLLALAIVAAGVAAWRYVSGLAATTNLDQEHPWGLWIAVDVATGVALAAGGFTTAALAHIFHREHYHAITRPALLTALLGYTFVGLGLLVDLGRYYNIWHPVLPSMWQGKSVLFEVGMCVMAYLIVLYVEFLPIVCERFMGDARFPRLGRGCGAVHRLVGRTMFLFILAGVVLSCLHQSSLGNLMVIAPSKMHPLWSTAILSLLFLLSAIAVGFPMVVVESLYASWSLGIKPELDVLKSLARYIPVLLGVYLAFKAGDLMIREGYRYLFEASVQSFMFGVEMVLGVILPLLMLLSARVRSRPGWLFAAALLVVLGVAVNRINVFLVAYQPPYAVQPYFPSLGEFVVTLGFIAALILCYRVIVTYFPVLCGERPFHVESSAHRSGDTRVYLRGPMPPDECGSSPPRPRRSVAAGGIRMVLFAAIMAASAAPAAAAATAFGQTSERDRRAVELLRMTCEQCHSCREPTREDPCLRPCARTELRRFEEEFSAKHGPRIVILDELEDIYLPVPFDHEGHANMARMAGGCALCHHYTPEGLEHPACKTCHEAAAGQGDIRKPGLKGAYHRQCMSCHREWSGEARCGACHQPKAGASHGAAAQPLPTPDDLIGRMHPPIPEPDVEVYRTEREGYPPTKVMFRHKEHVHGYGLRCAECHREDNCNRCHEPGKEHRQKVRSLGEHHKPCFECHRNHSCDRCHFEEGQAPPPPFDHSRTGWPLRSYHREKSCRACHPKVPFTKLDPNCHSCHQGWTNANFDHAVTGQQLDEIHGRLDCGDCHADRAFDRPPACDQCHEPEEGIIFPAKRPGAVVRPVP